MIIYGHRYIDSKQFYHIKDIDSISRTPSNSTLLITFKEANLDLVKYCKANDVAFILEVSSVKEAIFAKNLGAWGVIVERSLARSVQKIAQEYLFDTKVLCRVESDESIESVAFESIDAVVFKEAIVKV